MLKETVVGDREHVNNEVADDSERACPICGKAVAGGSPQHPFCSERCRSIDLGRWASESYKVSRPIEERDLDEE